MKVYLMVFKALMDFLKNIEFYTETKFAKQLALLSMKLSISL